MNTTAIFVDQRRLQLGPRLGKGGEGEVFSLEREEANAVKIYTVSDLVEREQKVEVMIRSGMASKAPQVAFPLSVARDETGRFSGFLMRNALGHKPLHELYSPGSRKIHFQQADYRFLVRTAQNIAKAIASVHAIDCVIGDINQSSILISKAATVALIDSDSFQVTDGDQTFFCRVGVPEYTPLRCRVYRWRRSQPQTTMPSGWPSSSFSYCSWGGIRSSAACGAESTVLV